jgi:hypothetical protein
MFRGAGFGVSEQQRKTVGEDNKLATEPQEPPHKMHPPDALSKERKRHHQEHPLPVPTKSNPYPSRTHHRLVVEGFACDVALSPEVLTSRVKPKLLKITEKMREI